MTTKEKQSVMDAARAYMADKGISQNELCERSGVNASYVVSMMKGDYTFINSRNGSPSNIKDIYFEKLAQAIGFSFQREYWPMIETPQLKDVYAFLMEAKEYSVNRMIIGETGCGKTYTLKFFAKNHPKGTYIVTCNDYDNRKDMIRKVETAIGKGSTGSDSLRMDNISIELDRLSETGIKPVLIFDESEYLKKYGLLGVKSIYDWVKDVCSVVLIGTQELLGNLKKIEMQTGMRQFISRFDAGTRMVRPIDHKYELFLNPRKFEEKLVKSIRDDAKDYRGLADNLIPALKEADRMGVTLTNDLYKAINHLKIQNND